MRTPFPLALAALSLIIPSLLSADPKVTVSVDNAKAGSAAADTVNGNSALPDSTEKGSFNEAVVDKLDGTIMVQPGDGSKPYALETGSSVKKGDTLTVYDQSWVILKTHKGDRIGLNGYPGQTVVSIDEYYIEGPDRQIRLILQKGILMLKTNNCGSRQSFFEINVGSVVAAIGDTQTVLNYDPAQSHLKVQYLRGKLTVIDKNNEHKFGVQPVIGSHIVDVRDKSSIADAEDENLEYIPEGSEYNWKDGLLADKAPSPIDELDANNFKRFFNFQPPLPPTDNNILLQGSD
jgi:hypothetical protein